MGWKPKRWIAVLLALVAPWLSMLYLMRPLLSLVYFLLALGTGVLAVAGGLKSDGGETLAFWSRIAMPLIGMVHAFWLAHRQSAVGHRPGYSRWYGLTGACVAMFVAVFTFRSFVFEPFRVPSTAMYPTFEPGSLIVVSKWGYGDYGTYRINLMTAPPTRSLQRGDVVVFEPPHKPGTRYVKRVIGVPGDLVEFRGTELVLNGETAEMTLVDEDSEQRIFEESLGGMRHRIARRTTPYVQPVVGHWRVPADSFFMLGDNRDNSEDSRHWGFVPAENLVGLMRWHF